MLTPAFSIIQTEESLVITIQAKYANVAETEIEYADRDFLFSAAPYFLRLFLPSEVVDDGTGTSKYDCDNGTFTITVPKLRKGEHFEGLDMISHLLRTQNVKCEQSARPLVEELEVEGEEEEDIEGNEYLVDQEEGIKLEEIAVDYNSVNFGYGFGWKKTGVLGRLKDEIVKLIDIEDPECTSIEDRKKESLEKDKNNFNDEHYLADTFDPDSYLEEILQWKWPNNILMITDDDRERMKNLPRRKLPKLSRDESYSISLSLIDILYAFCYDLRISMGDNNVESSWTYCRLSPSLSSLLKWESASEAVHGAARRSVVYPLYRNWLLVVQVFEDVKELFTQGRSSIVHCLCVIHREMVAGGDFRYLLNDLIITDLLLWVQEVDNTVLDTIQKELALVELSKDETGIELELLENEAKFQMMAVVDEDSDDE